MNSVKSLNVIGSNERSIMETIHKEFYFQSERRNVTSLQLWQLISSTLEALERNKKYQAKHKEKIDLILNDKEEPKFRKPKVVVMGKGQKFVKVLKSKPSMKPVSQDVKVDAKNPSTHLDGNKDYDK